MHYPLYKLKAMPTLYHGNYIYNNNIRFTLNVDDAYDDDDYDDDDTVMDRYVYKISIQFDMPNIGLKVISTS